MTSVAAWTDEVSSHGRIWTIEQRWTDDGVELFGRVREPYWSTAWEASALVRVRNGCLATFTGGSGRPETLRWGVARSMPTYAMELDALGAFVGRLAGKDFSRRYRSVAGIPAHRRFLVTLGHAASARLYGLCDPAATRATRRFRPGDRFALLAQFDLDPSGRLLEKVADAPGVLLLLVALAAGDADAAALAAQLRSALQAGRRLDRAIDEALEAHLAAMVAAPAQSPVDARARSSYLYLDGLRGDARHRALKRWRLLVRRARHHVEPRLLLRPPPVDFAPEDIPARLADNARWYACMAAHDALSSPQAAGGLDAAADFSRYVACHGWRFLSRGMVGTVLDFVRARPGLDVRRYDARRAHGLLLDWLRGLGPRASDAPLPPPPRPGLCEEGLEVWPLDTPALLARESETQGHCARTYEPRVRRRQSYLYAARAGAERLTVELAPDFSGEWGMVQVRGPANVLPSPEALARLARWCPSAPS